jgi:hypothetical protein
MNANTPLHATAGRAVAHHARTLLARPDTLAVGVGLKTVAGQMTAMPAMKVFVAHKRPLVELAPADVLPRTVSAPDGTTVLTDVEAMEPIEVPPPPAPMRAAENATAWPLRQAMRPALGGASIANALFSVGTMTLGVFDAFGYPYALSCNHVLGLLGQAVPGQPILQPSPADGGVWPASQIGTFARAVPMDFSPNAVNLVDGAIASVGAWSTLASIWSVGPPIGVASRSMLAVGQPVWKVGRTTGLTAGSIVALDATVKADYTRLGGPSTGMLGEQILTTSIAQFGDSGSLVYDAYLRALGMVCGGSSTNTVCNLMTNVTTALGIGF